MSNLILHCGAKFASRDDVATIPTPVPTATHFPVPHIDVLNAVERALSAGGREVTNWQHGLSADGQRYFGILTLTGVYGGDDGSGGQYSTVVGVRNAHDLSWAASIVAGSKVFVCDNLSFCGEVKLSRKHTRFIARDLERLAAQAVGKLGALHVQQADRFALYKEAGLDDLHAHDLIIRAVDARVLPNARISDVLQEWRRPSHEEFAGRSVWSLYNGFTEILKGTNNAHLPRRSECLHGMFDTAAAAIVGRRVRSLAEIAGLDGGTVDESYHVAV